MWRRLSLLASIGLVLGVAPSAGAATVTARVEPFATRVSYVVRVSAAPGEPNQLLVTFNDAVRVADSISLDAGEGCQKQPDRAVVCDPMIGGAPSVYVDTGDEDDNVRFDVGSAPMYASIDGGQGDDVLVGGGMGVNYFTGGIGNDRMVGGGGRNEFLEGTSPNGSDRFESAGGIYGDSVRYDARSRGVRVTFDGDANDGEPGERDFVSSSISSVYGGGGADVLVGNGRANGLVGAGGADVIRGAGGNDQLSGGYRLYGRVGSNDRLYGGPGSDRVEGNAGDDLLVGGPGRDDLKAFSGADRLFPGQGRDSVRAGPGDDLVDARDRDVDVVNCGLGQDRVRNDPVDWLVVGLCDRHDPGRSLRQGEAVRP